MLTTRQPVNRTLQIIIIASGFLAIVLLWAALVYHLSVQRNTIISQTHRDLRNLSSALSQQVERVLVSVDQIMEFVQEDFAHDRTTFSFDTWMQRATSLQTVAKQVIWYDPRGEYFAARKARGQDEQRANVRDREYFRVHAERSDVGLFLDRTQVGRVTGAKLFQMSRRMTAPDGSFAGVLVVSLDPTYLADQFKALDVGTNGSVALFGLDGYVRARQPERPGMYERDGLTMNAAPGVFAHLKESPAGSYQLTSGFDETERVLGYHAVGTLPLVVTVGKELSEVMIPFRAERNRILLVGVAGTLAIALGVFFVVRELERRRRRDALLLQAETALLKANDRLVLAEQIAQIGNWRVELPSRRHEWSDGMYRIHGLRPDGDEPTIEAVLDLSHPDYREEAASRLADAMSLGRDFDIASRIVQRSGAVRDIVCRGSCEVGPDGTTTAVFGIVMDVTDLRRAERKAEQTASLLEATLESMDQGLIVISPESRVEICNSRAAALLDLDAEILAQRPTAQEVLDRQWARGEFDKAGPDALQILRQGAGAVISNSYVRTRPDGTVLEIRTSPMSDGGVVRTYSDITERRTAEDALQSSESRYRLLADNASDLIVLTQPDGRDAYVSPAITTMLGYPAQDADTIRLYNLVHPEDFAKVFAETTALSAEQPKTSIVYRVKHANGQYIWVEAALTRVQDGGGAIVSAIRDVTQQQRQARHLEKAKIAAEAGARVKAEFLANMSHELRTPLTGILGVHDLLRDEPGLNERQQRFVGLAQESGHSLLRIVNDILDFSKIEAGQMAIERLPYGLRELIEGCCALGAEMIRKPDVSIRAEVESDVPDRLMGDPTRLRQILLNLVSNALKFTTAGEVAIRVTCTADRLRVAVSDTGIGIAPAALPRLFERFNQADSSTSRRFGGTGLGLAICKRLVELMRGQIGVESKLDEGSCFWIDLPLERAEASLEGERVAARPGPSGAPRRRILVAEDNRVNNEIIEAALSGKGHEIVIVENGVAVVEEFRSARFDLVLMDVQMPFQDGLSATREIRRFERDAGRPATPIVALTANAMAEEIEACRQAGMDDHVAKPIDWPVLFGTIERICSPA